MSPRFRHLLRLVAVVTCAGLLTMFMVWALQGAHPSYRRASFQDERHIAYRATTERGPVFSLENRSGVFRIQSYLHLPYVTDPSNYDPERRYKYGLEVLVRDADGEIVQRRSTWMTTRNSKADWRDGRWEKAGSYYPVGEGDGEPCDSRLTTVDLSAWNDPAHSFEIRMRVPDRLTHAEERSPPKGAEVNLLVYRQFARPEDQRKWRRRTVSRTRRRELARRAGFEQWHQMTRTERDRTIRFGWSRISTISETPLRTLYQTGFRARTDALVPQVGEVLRAGQTLAYNVAGPTTLHVGILPPSGSLPGERRSARTLRLSSLLSSPSASPPIVRRDRESTLRVADTEVATIPSDLPRTSRAIFEVPPGRRGTVQLTLEEGPPVRMMAWLEGPTAPLGRTPSTPVTDRYDLTGPDWTTFFGWEARPQGPPIDFTVAGDEARVGEAIRISARPIDASPASTDPASDEDPRLVYEFVGADQRRRRTIALESPRTPFERLEPIDEVRSEAQMRPPAIRDPSYHRLWIPKWARRLRVASTGGRLVVDLSTLPDPDDYPEPKLAAPYQPPPTHLEWRYADRHVSPWQSLEPSNAAELTDARRRRQYDAQVRLRPDWDTFGPDKLTEARREVCPSGTDGCRFADAMADDQTRSTPHETAVVVRPDEPFGSGVAVELADLQPHDRPSLQQLADEWSENFRLGVRAGRSVRCRAPDDGSIAIDYRFTDHTLLGETLDIRWQEAVVSSTMMRTDRDRLVVDVPPGPGRLKLDVPNAASGALQAYVECRPLEVTDAATVWRFRRVHPLDPGSSMTVRVYSSPDDAPALNVVAYSSPEIEQFRLESTVDGGAPPRRTDGPVDQLTDPTRTLEFDVPSRARNRLRRSPESRLAGPAPQFVPIGSDWAPGWHEVELTLPSETAERVWLRFFLLTSDPEVARRNGRAQ